MKVTPSILFLAAAAALGGVAITVPAECLAQSAKPTATARKSIPALVSRVDFKRPRVGGKLPVQRVEVEVLANANAKLLEDPAAIVPHPEWVDKIKVTVTIAYENKGFKKAKKTAAAANASTDDQFIFYRASSTILTLKRNDKTSVFFYLPGEIVQRDALLAHPAYYTVELEVDGTAVDMFNAVGQPLSKAALSTNLQAPRKANETTSAFDGFKSMADRGATATAGILRTQPQVAGSIHDPEWQRAATLLREDTTR
jgi:hypothetical protein